MATHFHELTKLADGATVDDLQCGESAAVAVDDRPYSHITNLHVTAQVQGEVAHVPLLLECGC
jgi:DNA mismatch repair ATPase MutS